MGSDAEAAKDLIEAGVLNDADKIGIIEAGKVTVGVFFGLLQFAVVGAEVIDGECACTMQRINFVRVIFRSVADTFGVPVESDLAGIYHARQVGVEGELVGIRIVEIDIANKAVHGPGFEDLVGDIQETAVFGVDENRAEVDGRPVVLAVKFPCQDMSALVALREFGGIGGSEEKNGFRTKRRKKIDGLTAFPAQNGDLMG